MYVKVFTLLVSIAAASVAEQSEVCSEPSSVQAQSLLQARRAVAKAGINPSGAAAPLDEAGYSAVADRCCQEEMKVFIARQVVNLGMEVCIADGLTGIVPYHSCGTKGPQTFDVLTSNLLNDAGSKCPWLANTGSCKPLDPSCPTFEGVPPLADCGCSRSKAVILDFEKATMINNNLGGKGPATGPEEMRFGNIGEYPAGQPFDLVMATTDRYESAHASFNGVTKFPKFGNIAMNGAGNPAGFTGEIKLKFSFFRPGSTTPVQLPEVFFAAFDVDGTAGVNYQTLSGKGYTGYVTDVDTVLVASKADDGSTRFSAEKVDVPNPTDPMRATKKQRQSMVMYFFVNVSTFDMSLGVLGSGGARNFNFAGKSALMDRCGA